MKCLPTCLEIHSRKSKYGWRIEYNKLIFDVLPFNSCKNRANFSTDVNNILTKVCPEFINAFGNSTTLIKTITNISAVYILYFRAPLSWERSFAEELLEELLSEHPAMDVKKEEKILKYLRSRLRKYAGDSYAR